MLRQSSSRMLRSSSSRSLFSEDSTLIPTDQVRDIAEQAKSKVRQQVEGFARAVLRDSCRPKRGSIYADHALKVLQNKDKRQDGSAEKAKRGVSKGVRDRLKYKIRASPKQTTSPGLSSVMNRVLKLNTPSMKASSAKKKTGAKAKDASSASNNVHYLGEDEDNLLWQLRQKDPGLMKDRYALPTGKLRGSRLGFAGDVVSNHSILVELERRGVTKVLTEREEQEAMDASLRDLFTHNVKHLEAVVTETQCSYQILGSAHVHQQSTFATVLSNILTLLKRCIKALQESELPAATGHDVADYELGTLSNKSQTMRRITALAMSLSWETKCHQEQLDEIERKAARSVPFLRRADWEAAHSLYYALEEASDILRGRKAVYQTSEAAQQEAKEQDVQNTVTRAESCAAAAEARTEMRRKSLLRSMSNVAQAAQAAIKLQDSKRNLFDPQLPEAMDIDPASSSTPRPHEASLNATLSSHHDAAANSTPGLHRILALRQRPPTSGSTPSPSKLRRSLRRDSPAEPKLLPNSEKKLRPSPAHQPPFSMPRPSAGLEAGVRASHDAASTAGVATRLRFPRLQKGVAPAASDEERAALDPGHGTTFLTDSPPLRDGARHALVRRSDPGSTSAAGGLGASETFGERRKRQAPARLRIQG